MGTIDRLLMALALAVGVSIAVAQDPGPTFENTIVPRYGRLFAIDYNPGARTIRVSLVGKTMKGLTSDQYLLTAETMDSEGLAKQLDLVSTTEGYKFKDVLPAKKEIKVKVQDKKTKETELFMLKP